MLTEQSQPRERVLLVHVQFPSGNMEEDLNEFQALAQSAGALIIDTIITSRAHPTAKYFIGSGKAEEISQTVAAYQIELVIFNHILTPGQERNLERLFKCRVLDRTGLILDIFARRARSFEGKLQVELAQLTYLSTRLTRAWTHLERQRGGIGLKGPGETQLEVDKRLIHDRIKTIKIRLEKLRKQRAQSRTSRQRAIIPTVALVGYTNAGKSTLFNAFTQADVYVQDQLFATLDTTLRRVNTAEISKNKYLSCEFILADTVGFIRHLPHTLIDAFHATLEEVVEADLLIHVVDSQNEEREKHIEEVNAVLAQIGADKVPVCLGFNKIDQNPLLQPRLDRNDINHITRVWFSAQSGVGIDLLCQAIAELLDQNVIERYIVLSPQEGKRRALIYQHGTVLEERVDEEGKCHLLVRMTQVVFDKFFD